MLYFLYMITLISTKCAISENSNKIFRNAILTSQPINSHIYLTNEDYGQHIEEIEFTQTMTVLSQFSDRQLNSFRRLFINEIEIVLEDLETGESVLESNLIKAKYQDDVQFECDLPRSLLRENTYDWSMNGVFLNLNDSSYSVILDKRVNTNKTFMNVSCHFYLDGQLKLASLGFPPINLGLK